jgi:hypothetical protein
LAVNGGEPLPVCGGHLWLGQVPSGGPVAAWVPQPFVDDDRVQGQCASGHGDQRETVSWPSGVFHTEEVENGKRTTCDPTIWRIRRSSASASGTPGAAIARAWSSSAMPWIIRPPAVLASAASYRVAAGGTMIRPLHCWLCRRGSAPGDLQSGVVR